MNVLWNLYALSLTLTWCSWKWKSGKTLLEIEKWKSWKALLEKPLLVNNNSKRYCLHVLLFIIVSKQCYLVKLQPNHNPNHDFYFPTIKPLFYFLYIQTLDLTIKQTIIQQCNLNSLGMPLLVSVTSPFS